MTSIRQSMAVKITRQALPNSLIAGFFTPIKNSLHDGITVFCGSGYGVEERNKGDIPNTYPDRNDRRKPTMECLIEAIAASTKSGFIRQTMETEMSKNQITANFHGHSLNVLNHNNQPYVSAKQITEAIGLDWKGQYSKLKSNPERWTMEKISMVAQDGTLRETICLPLRKLSGWLMTIQPNKVSPELRPRIIQFQNECDDVLADHWEQQQQPAQAANATPLLEQTGAMALSPVKLNHAEQDILQTIAGHLAAHSRTDEAVTITVALQQSEKAVVKALIGELTVFQNTDLKPFITHYNKTVKLSTNKYDALNTLLRAGSFIEGES